MLINQLPKSWSEIPFSQYQELIEIRTQEWESDIELKIEELSLFLDIAPDDPSWDSISVDELYEKYNGISWTNTPIKGIVPNSFTKDSQLWEIPPWTNLSLGEWIDLEHYLQEPHKNAHIIAACCFKKVISSGEDKKWEPYEYSPLDRADKFSTMNPQELIGVIEGFSKWKAGIMKDYSSIFEDPDWDKIEGEDQLPPEEVNRIRKEIAHDKKKAPFSWLGIVWELSGHDITKFDEVFKTPVILVFNVLAMKKALKV